MTAEARVSVAFIAGCLILGKGSTYAYDFGRSKFVNFSGTVKLSLVQVFNHEVGGHITGNGFADSINLFDHRRGSHIQLHLAGRDFNGFDFGSGTHFSGSVNGEAINLYDYGEGKHFNYTI